MSAEPFVDTNVLLYAHDIGAGEKYELARDLVTTLWMTGGACLSVQVLQELYVNLSKKVPGVSPTDASRITASYTKWRVQRPSAADVIAGIELHQQHQLSFWDAMIVISANKLGCTRLLTEDLNDRQRILDVTIENPFAIH